MSEVMNRLMRKDVQWVTDSYSEKCYDSYGLQNALVTWTDCHKDCFVQAMSTTCVPNSIEVIVSIVYLRPAQPNEIVEEEVQF